MSSKAKIEQILREKFEPVRLVVSDDSQAHAGHNPDAAKGGTHFSVVIVSDIFEGKTRVERHRMVYEALGDEFKGGLHALAIKAYLSKEYLD